jgi:hypothetical protein
VDHFLFETNGLLEKAKEAASSMGQIIFLEIPFFFGRTRLNMFDGEDFDSTLLSEYVMQRCRCHKPVGCQVLSVLSLISLPGSSLFVIR